MHGTKVVVVWLDAVTRVKGSLDDGFCGLHDIGVCVVVLDVLRYYCVQAFMHNLCE